MILKRSFFSWVVQLIAAAILLETLMYKFGVFPELEVHSIFIFYKIGQAIGVPDIEPHGRFTTGVIELITSVLLLIPNIKIIRVGAVLGIMTMIGAIIAHLTVLGIEVENDGSQLFIMAWVVLLCCSLTLWFRR